MSLNDTSFKGTDLENDTQVLCWSNKHLGFRAKFQTHFGDL